MKRKEENLRQQIEKPKSPEPNEDMVPIEYEKQVENDKKMDWFDVTEDGAACLEVITENMASLNVDIAESELNSELTDYLEDELNDNHPVEEEFPLIECAPPGDEVVDNAHVVTDIDKENQSKYFYFYQGNTLFVILNIV